MKILTFSGYYTPEIAASMYLTEDMLQAMTEAGHEVELYVPTPCRGVSDEVRREYKKKKTERFYSDKLTVHRFALYKEGKNPLLRALRYGLLNLIFIIKGLSKKADVIFVQSTPPTQGLVAGFLKAVKHIPFVYNLQDVFPDSLVNTGLTSEGSLIWKIGRKVEDFTYRHADKIIVISEDFKKNIMAKGVPEDKITVVPNWADTKGVYPVDRQDNRLIEKYGLDPELFYITYCGNIGYTQNTELLLTCAKKLKDELPDLRFVLIGEGAARDEVERTIAEDKIENVILLPFQPYEDIAHVFSLGDVGLIISKPGVGSNSVPSKTWSIMAAEKPILASFDRDSELSRLVEKNNCGCVADAGDENGFITAVREMYSNREKTAAQGKNGQAFLSSEFDKDICVAKYVEVLEKVGGKMR